MASFIFVRHGKSQANVGKMIANDISPLAQEGKAQARKVGRSLKGAGIVRILSSPLPRALETAQIIASQLGITHVEQVDELRERNLGGLMGGPKEHESAWYFTIDGQYNVEPLTAVMDRCQVALQHIEAAAQEGKVLVVGHAMAGFYLEQVAAGKRLPQECDPPTELANAGVAEVAIIVPASSRQTAAASLTRTQMMLLGGALLLCVLAATAWIFWPPNNETQAPTAGSGGSRPVPMSIDDFSDSPNLQGAIQQQLNSHQSSSLQPQAKNPLQQTQTAPNLQSPQ